jgi:formate C-acetyltransferase
VEDLQILNSREMTTYMVSEQDIDSYKKEVIPYWQGRTMRERVFNQVPPEWQTAYARPRPYDPGWDYLSKRHAGF